MTWADFHTHCRFCDGAAEPAVMLQTAIEKNLRAYGFSSHAPVPFDTNWTMRPDRLSEYVRTIQELKASAPIPVYLGLEIDFIPGVTSPDTPLFSNLPLDYRLASVHFLGEDVSQGRFWWTVDDSDEVFARGLHEIFNDDIRDLVERYYARIRELVRTQSFDVLGHIDLVKKNNADGKYFSEDAPWYRDAVDETLETIAASGCIMEVNTGGISRNKIKTLYPSDWILERAAKLKIPIMLNSDCHAPSQIAALFPESAAKLLALGFRTLHVLHNGVCQALPFSTEGINWTATT
jgi:histidinol-phosphatase (PHP family)